MNNTNSSSEVQIQPLDPFFFAFAIILLSIVILGFAPSLFMRFAFDPPPIPLYLHLHGMILTGWFVWLVTQAWLIRRENPALHRRLGFFAAGYAPLVVIGGLMASMNMVSRELASGVTFDTDMADINPAMGAGISYLTFASGVVWSNISSVCSFAVLIGAAVFFRGQAAAHKRLILVATVSITGPPLARMSRLEILGGEQGPFILLAILSLLAAIAAHDLLTLRKVHWASLAAIIFTLASNFLGAVIAGSAFGQEFVRSLA
jgi:hypothetical protein